MNPQSCYLTTPIYYVNAKPHLGHAYTTIIADVLARAHRQRGEETFLLTGTDEHGEKIAQAATEQGLKPQAFVDRGSEAFRKLWAAFNISYDDFIRTTEPRHQKVVQAMLERLRPELELGSYRFWYCVPCETNWGPDEVDKAKALCPSCKRPISQVEEEDYFLPLENHRAWLRGHIEKNKNFILPVVRRNELLAMLEKPLPPLCITRPKERVSWGIEVPFSPGHVTYVWLDALVNYISALGWPDGARFRQHWMGSGAIHLIGKDILRHHALYWPIILHAAGIPPPKTIFAHGWWMIKGEKMSKSKGNIIEPEAVIATYGLDAFRHFLLSEVPLGDDGFFSQGALVKRINSDLANDLGNLVYRTLTMLEKHTGGKIPEGQLSGQTRQNITETAQNLWRALEALAPDRAVRSLWNLVGQANRSVEQAAPWTLARENRRDELENFMVQLSEQVRATALLLWPFLPMTAESIWKQLGFGSALPEQRLPQALETAIPPGQAIQKGKPLFPRLEK